ncbi:MULTISPECIES: GNAT family N-acetyltransferase [unclassified Sphingomonas]|uniref:GNAT family N-acetyltransferase n=1 Tax=unclassified Sphingomonas TaxID=196159 RepID=UPI0022B47823|nr:GNAT family N-acetyltransferase [Sphingomonas sp. NIBR02145]WHU01973.1 GNAT family N-acetyltransferase [Sphingomonas sp. NIBR02145]
MSSSVAIERVATLDPAWLAGCDFAFDPSGRAYPFDNAFAVPRAARMLALARVDGQVAGYIACTRDGDSAEVRRIEIDRVRRGQGVGQCLLGEARAWAGEQGLSALRLETLADNPEAGRFFARHGFVRTQAADALHWHLPLQP